LNEVFASSRSVRMRHLVVAEVFDWSIW